MNRTPYMDEPWFALLVDACKGSSKQRVAQLLGVSTPTVCQVTNGSGLYGRGQASTDKLAERVRNILGSFRCPHLSEQDGTERVIRAEQCRAYAHRAAPTSSPRDLAHWQACRTCKHKALSAPPPPRAVVPRKPKPGDPKQQEIEA